MYLTTKFFDTFDNVLDAFHNKEYYGSTFNNDEVTNLELALPGFSKKDINIEVEGRTLIVSSNVSEEKETKYYKSFKKSYLLPINADSENINASMINGLLTIDFGNKSETKTISIK